MLDHTTDLATTAIIFGDTTSTSDPTEIEAPKYQCRPFQVNFNNNNLVDVHFLYVKNSELSTSKLDPTLGF